MLEKGQIRINRHVSKVWDKHPENEKELIKDAWMLEEEYGDVFELVALQPDVDRNQLK